MKTLKQVVPLHERARIATNLLILDRLEVYLDERSAQQVGMPCWKCGKPCRSCTAESPAITKARNRAPALAEYTRNVLETVRQANEFRYDARPRLVWGCVSSCRLDGSLTQISVASARSRLACSSTSSVASTPGRPRHSSSHPPRTESTSSALRECSLLDASVPLITDRVYHLSEAALWIKLAEWACHEAHSTRASVKQRDWFVTIWHTCTDAVINMRFVTYRYLGRALERR